MTNLRTAIADMGLDPVSGLADLRKQYADALRASANKENEHANPSVGAGDDSQ